MNKTACECPAAGWCARHQMHKSPTERHRCQTNPKLWNYWEAGKDPRQGQHVEEEPPRFIETRGTGTLTLHKTSEPPRPLLDGPGSELFRLNADLGIVEKPGCDCRFLQGEMDRVGVVGCREQREQFLKRLRANADKYSWWDYLKAGANAVRLGLATRVNWTDSLPDLFDLAVDWYAAGGRDKQPRPAIEVRHLVYHLWANENEAVWRWNLQQLAKHADLFNGVKVLSLVGDDPDKALRVVEAVGLKFDRVFEGPNDPERGESVFYEAAIRHVLGQDLKTENHAAIAYAHAKGVKHPDAFETGVIPWTESLYDLCFGRWDLAEEVLRYHGFAGAYLCPGEDEFDTPHHWHYPGGFRWMRCDSLRTDVFPFGKCKDYYAVEAWPGHWPRSEAGEIARLLGDYPQRGKNGAEMYYPETWGQPARPKPVTRQPDVQSGPSVSVVVTCHNYGRFLGECLQSILDQTYPVFELLVVDDSSTDDTAQVVGSFSAKGIRYLRVEHWNSHLSRGAGFAKTTGEIVLFVDADNHLPPDYIASGIGAFSDPFTGVVYADQCKFGISTGRTNFSEEFSRERLARGNFVDTCSLIRRSALEVANVFDSDINPRTTPEDMAMFLRLAEDGWHFEKQSSCVNYRTHEDQQSRQAAQSFNGRRYQDEYCLGQQPITLFIALSGRGFAWDAQLHYLERQTWPHERLRLILCDTSQNAEFSASVREWLSSCDYPDVRYFQFAPAAPGLADRDRHQSATEREVQLAMCRIYNRLRLALETNYCWILEDDIIPPNDALERLLEHFAANVGSVCAPYPSRHDPDYVVWDGDPDGANMRRASVPEVGQHWVQPVRGSGFGCMVVRSELLKKHVFHMPPGEQWFDPPFFKQLGDDWQRLCDWSVMCLHLGPRTYSIPSATVGRVQAAIDAAELGESILPDSVLSLEGMSSNKVRHFLSNLHARNYLEVGCWKGSTLVSACWGQDVTATVIDDFSQFNEAGDVREIFRRNVSEHLPDSKVTLIEQSVHDLQRDALSRGVDTLFLDGDHTPEAHREVIIKLWPCLADEAVIVIDDANFADALDGTLQGMLAVGAHIVQEWRLPARFNGDTEQWWNGLYVAVVKR